MEKHYKGKNNLVNDFSLDSDTNLKESQTRVYGNSSIQFMENYMWNQKKVWM